MTNTCFLLGAGFTADVSESQFPTLIELLENLKNIDQNMYYKYQFDKDENIEISFTRIDIDSLRGNNNDLENKRINLLEKTEELFSMKDKQLKDNAQSKVFLDCLKKEDMILTTNYECYLENLLEYG